MIVLLPYKLLLYNNTELHNVMLTVPRVLGLLYLWSNMQQNHASAQTIKVKVHMDINIVSIARHALEKFYEL